MVSLGKLTRRELRQRVESGELQGVILPIGATEQHLEHLALEHDWRSVCWVAHELARRLAPRLLVVEGLPVGISEHHMRHPGTLSLRPGTFLAVLADLIRSVCAAGFRHVLVLNGHGGNVAPCRAVWDQFLREFQINLQFLSYWDVLTAQDARELLRSGDRLPEDLPGHAQEFETSIALAAFAENVRQEAISDQADPTPAFASSLTGQQLLERVLDRLQERLERMLQGRSTAPLPPFQ